MAFLRFLVAICLEKYNESRRRVEEKKLKYNNEGVLLFHNLHYQPLIEKFRINVEQAFFSFFFFFQHRKKEKKSQQSLQDRAKQK